MSLLNNNYKNENSTTKYNTVQKVYESPKTKIYIVLFHFAKLIHLTNNDKVIFSFSQEKSPKLIDLSKYVNLWFTKNLPLLTRNIESLAYKYFYKVFNYCQVPCNRTTYSFYAQEYAWIFITK